jgi:hypothetical protein
MTRGTLYYISNDGVASSTEFNGDMYREGHGDQVLAGLSYDVTDFNSFVAFVNAFNAENFEYEEELIYDASKYMFDNEDQTLIDFRNEYFNRFGSDYIFIKNDSDRDITIIDKDNSKEFIIESGKTKRLNYGHVNNTFFKYDDSFDWDTRIKYI